jgi:hypothetical protein
MCTKFWTEILKSSDHSEDLGIDGRIILKCIIKKKGATVWTGFIWFRTGASGGSCEHGNEP